MTATAPALEWLEGEFDSQQETFDLLDPPPGGPAIIRPMISLRPLTDSGETMTIGAADYHDPERVWL